LISQSGGKLLSTQSGQFYQKPAGKIIKNGCLKSQIYENQEDTQRIVKFEIKPIIYTFEKDPEYWENYNDIEELEQMMRLHEITRKAIEKVNNIDTEISIGKYEAIIEKTMGDFLNLTWSDYTNFDHENANLVKENVEIQHSISKLYYQELVIVFFL